MLRDCKVDRLARREWKATGANWKRWVCTDAAELVVEVDEALAALEPSLLNVGRWADSPDATGTTLQTPLEISMRALSLMAAY